MTAFEAPSPPYAGPAAHVMHDANGKPWTNNTSPLDRIVIHGTVTPCGRGWARKVAADFRTTSEYKSAHYVVDPGEAVQVVWDSEVAEAAPPNPHSVHVELCDPETGAATRWHDDDHESMLRIAAGLVAQLCLAYDVPVERIGPRELLAGKRGICGHVDVSHAWHQTDHTDPIGFPWAHFMRLVEAEVKVRKAAPTATHERKAHSAKHTRGTRGKAVAAAIKATSSIRGGKVRKAAKRQALRALRSIPFLPRKKR